MMRAIDTNVLVYAAQDKSVGHSIAEQEIKELAEGALPWAIPWPCIYEFLRVVTHPMAYHPAIPLQVAIKELRGLLSAPGLILLGETAVHMDVLTKILSESGATGNLVHDAHIAALCLEHGVSELITGDRDFARFPSLKIRNPFA
jgi:toxin-antitoxin system PIN domain toxin